MGRSPRTALDTTPVPPAAAGRWRGCLPPRARRASGRPRPWWCRARRASVRPRSVERHTRVPLASQPSSGEVKQTDWGGAGAACADQVRPPSTEWTSRVAPVGTIGPSPAWSPPPATPQPSVRLTKWTRRRAPTDGSASLVQCWPPSAVASTRPSPSTQPVEVVEKFTSRRSPLPRLTRTQVRPPSRVARIVSLPTTTALAGPVTCTASRLLTLPSGSVVEVVAPAPGAPVGGGAGAVVAGPGAVWLGGGATWPASWVLGISPARTPTAPAITAATASSVPPTRLRRRRLPRARMRRGSGGSAAPATGSAKDRNICRSSSSRMADLRGPRLAQLALQRGPGAEQAALDGTGRDLQHPPDLLHWQVGQGVQHQHLAVPPRQAPERLTEQHRLLRGRRRRRRRPHPAVGDQLAAGAPQRADRQVESDPANPGVRMVVVTDALPAHRGAGERLLHGVLGVGPPDHAVQLGHQPSIAPQVERVEVVLWSHRPSDVARLVPDRSGAPLRFGSGSTLAKDFNGGRIQRKMTSRPPLQGGCEVRMLAMALKELRQLRRDRRTVALMVGLPIVLLVVFGYAASFDVDQLRTVVVGPGSRWSPSTRTRGGPTRCAACATAAPRSRS